MEGSMRETTTMIKNKDMEFSFGLIKGSTTVNGTMVNNMVKAHIPLVSKKSGEESGKKEKELGGLPMKNEGIKVTQPLAE